MYSVFQRIGSIFSFSTSVLMCMAIITALSAWFLTKEPEQISLSLKSASFTPGRDGHYYVKSTELMQVLASLEADFSPLFNWNVKEVFAFLVIEYASIKKNGKELHNELVLWDRVIVSDSLGQSLKKANSLRFATLNHKFKVSNLSNKYVIADMNNLFSDKLNYFIINRNAIKDLRLVLKWTTFPWIGAIFHKASGETSIPFSVL